jgi:pimeloyl-ACP methyl ester carboxylesterase
MSSVARAARWSCCTATPRRGTCGARSCHTFLIEQAELVASDVRGQVVTGASHWLMEEAPNTVIPAINDFVA